ncbi:MAG: hypothetical protein PF694_04215 [Bacteroidetes bacterium]|jgi:hypothetical protein|nr:hypothetical protein [Bacteroidota bacterium]
MSTRAKQPKYIPKPGPVDHTLEWASAKTLILSWFFALYITGQERDSHVLRWLLPAILVPSFLPLVIYFSASNKRK